ncbi:hypothetical protein KVR01_008476 [Diaporthe batatas]|uniref:uncharacterized protein n=1 Tax=Diaporthe batatas TaxID=748121 RepID=UPI001D038034|nr:uncharacterized protein KVR01_008476 [Diaporthe batatas]KAG8161489.1 hypothetical protein KVR01_008476 [Diaporthe batatas]
MNKLADINALIDDGVSDKTLPLSMLPESCSTNTFQLGSNRTSKKSIRQLECFAKWDAIDVWTFEEWQWTTLSPVLERGGRRNVKHLIIRDEVPLPFTDDSRYSSDAHTLIQGGFSTVSKVHIHPANHRFQGPENVHNDHFAVKCLSSRTRQDFKQEVDMLMTYSGDTHPHLISLLATYEQYQMFYLIFPWAEADLQCYLERINPHPKMDYPTVQWLAQQCHGFASGLCQLHRHQTTYVSNAWSDNETKSSETHEIGRTTQVQLYGRHGDIKLQNILWFCDPKKSGDRGVLKITDFGLAEFKTSPARLYRGASRMKFSPPYQPPECNTPGGRVGQSHDIWSLGCLYLELIAWLLGGWELVKSFQSARESTDPEYYAKAINGTFFTIIPGGGDGLGVAVVKPAVKQFIDSLHSHAACSEYLHKFLDLIETDMLIIKSTNPIEMRRIGIPELNVQLGALYRQVCGDATFATTAATRNLQDT